MSLTGTDAHLALIEAIRDIRREENDLLSRLAHGAALVGALKVHESELFRQVAAIRLESEARAALSNELIGRERELSAAVAALEARMTPTMADVTALDAQIASLFERRGTVQREMARQQRDLDGMARKARPALAENAEYLAAKAAAARASEIALASRRKADDALAKHAAREKVFREDALFAYLTERGYDTRAYRGNLLSGWFDRLIAELIGFRRGRQLFQLGNDLPIAWHEHAVAQGEKAVQAARRRDELESVAVDAIGGRAVRDALAANRHRLADIDRQTVETEDRRDEALKAWRDLAQANEIAYTAALDQLSTALNRSDLWTMLAEARETPKGRDIAAVQQIDELRERARDETEEMRELRNQLRTLALRRRDLEDLTYEMRAQRIDGAESHYEQAQLVAEDLNAFLRGEMGVAAYWDRWRAAHRFVDEGAHSTVKSPLSRPRGQARSDMVPVLA